MPPNDTSDAAYDETYYQQNGQSGDRPALWMYERLWKHYCNTAGPVLEFGGGAGWFAKRLSHHADVFACEANDFARASIAKIAPLATRLGDLSDMADASVESIVALHVLEHIPDEGLKGILGEFHRISRPGARFLFVMPDLIGRANAIKGKQWSAFNDPTHINLKGHAEWDIFFKAHGYKTIQTFADGFYDFPYERTLAGKTILDGLRLARTGFQFLLARPILRPGDGENVVFILESDQL